MANITKADVNDRLWNNLVGRIHANIGINGAHPHAQGTYNFTYDPRGSIDNRLSAIPYWVQAREAGRALADYFRSATYALYGIVGDIAPAYSGYAYFWTDSSYHAAHFNNQDARINAQATQGNPGSIALGTLEAYYNALSSIIINYSAEQVPDLRICHGSCHTNCHASRGRR